MSTFFIVMKTKAILQIFPILSHCSAFGKSPEEALLEVLNAKAAWLESARANRKPIPTPHYRPVIYQVA